jgi:hypothetical protein
MIKTLLYPAHKTGDRYFDISSRQEPVSLSPTRSSAQTPDLRKVRCPNTFFTDAEPHGWDSKFSFGQHGHIYVWVKRREDFKGILTYF